MSGVRGFLVEYIPFFNLYHGRKCPFSSLAPPALTLLRRPCLPKLRISLKIQRKKQDKYLDEQLHSSLDE